MENIDKLYVKARKVLLDGLEALHDHLDNVILVGAQAVYVHAGEADVAVAPFTTDGDIALDARLLAPKPLIEEALASKGFVRGAQPGEWRGQDDVVLDLMVPSGIVHGGSRSARIPPHHKHVARKALGLEGVLVDNSVHELGALDPDDSRQFSVRVAGPASLFVSKLVKLKERWDEPQRLADKDAYDVYRLLRKTDTKELATKLSVLRADSLAGQTCATAIEMFAEHFTKEDARGIRLIVKHTGPLEGADELAAVSTALGRRLHGALEVEH